MADFVAVIRRAVDGLTENTPEMRVRVYDKARGAVVRQLENMNPRPPEAMFKRQLDKLDAAIRQVEEEHGEAVAAEEAPAEPQHAAIETSAELSAGPAETPPPEEAAYEEPPRPAQPFEESAPEESVHAQSTFEEPAHEVPALAEPAYQEPTSAEAQSEEIDAWSTPARQAVEPVEPAAHAEPVSYSEPAVDQQAEPREHPVELDGEPVAHEQAQSSPARAVEPEAAQFTETVRHEQPVHHELEETAAGEGAEPDHHVAEVREAQQPDERDDPLLSHFEPARPPAIRHASNRVMEEPLVSAESEFPSDESVAEQPVEKFDRFDVEPGRDESAAAPVAAMPEWGVDIDREPEAARDEPEHVPQMPRAALTETDVATGFNDFLKNEFSTPSVKPPPARKEPENDFSWDAPFDDLPDLPKPVAFQEALQARQEEMARPAGDGTEKARDPRSELEDLIGYRPANFGADTNDQGEKLPPDVSPRAMSKLQSKGFKVRKKDKQKLNALPIAFGVAGALVVAAGAYAVYAYRDDVSAIVASYIPGASTPATTDTRTVDEKTGDQSKAVTVDGKDAASNQPAAAQEETTEVASLDANIVPTKFTQRLLEDGTETETDAAKIPVDQSLSEGKTVAGQTEVASSTPDATTTTEQAVETPGLTVTQKMFLYEERLGGSPVAVPGTVSWGLKNDTTSTGGKDQPMVEATIEVPERKLKAVVTFKRNSDVSLPASHIIEIVFDLPEDFEEGNVESVQRVAFKQTEQDRGNSLIAVPAKITDDFHMIALNDDADARKVNLDLMKSRSWIDIPLVYRNNRRALLTFEKGSTGTDAFDKALAQWAALGPTATSN